AEEIVHHQHLLAAPAGDIAALRAHHAGEVAAERVIVAHVLGGPQESHIAAEAGEILAQLRNNAVGRQLVVVERVVSHRFAGGGDQLASSGRGLPHRQRGGRRQGRRVDRDVLVIERIAPLYERRLGDRRAY